MDPDQMTPKSHDYHWVALSAFIYILTASARGVYRLLGLSTKRRVP